MNYLNTYVFLQDTSERLMLRVNKWLIPELSVLLVVLRAVPFKTESTKMDFVNQILCHSKKSSLKPVDLLWFMLFKKLKMKEKWGLNFLLFLWTLVKEVSCKTVPQGHQNYFICPPDTASFRPLPPAHPISRRARWQAFSRAAQDVAAWSRSLKLAPFMPKKWQDLSYPIAEPSPKSLALVPCVCRNIYLSWV